MWQESISLTEVRAMKYAAMLVKGEGAVYNPNVSLSL